MDAQKTRLIGTKTFVAGMSVGLLASVALIGWGTSPALRAETALPEGNQTAIVQNAADGSQVVYLLDGAERTLCVYQYDPRKGKLKLAAARHLRADQQLLEFNNEEPHVSDIEKLARSR